MKKLKTRKEAEKEVAECDRIMIEKYPQLKGQIYSPVIWDYDPKNPNQ